MPHVVTNKLLGYKFGTPIYEGKSPVCDKMIAAFNTQPWDECFWQAYDNAIYCVNVPIPPDVVVLHEQVHFQQMARYPGGCDPWWDRYLTDKEFAIEQECEAYTIDIIEGYKNYEGCIRSLTTSCYGSPPRELVVKHLDAWCTKRGIAPWRDQPYSPSIRAAGNADLM